MSSTSATIPTTPRRREIRLAALHLFAEHGYRPTTMADIGDRAGLRGPSIYRHFESKQQILTDIVFRTMYELMAVQREALAVDDPAGRLRRMTEAHVRYHVHHRRESTVGNGEIDSLEEPARTELLALRSRYERGFRSVIERGVEARIFHVDSVRLVSYAILDMGMGVSRWYRENGPASGDRIAEIHGGLALRICGVDPDRTPT